MKLKYLATLLTIVLLVGILAACGGDETPTPEPQPTDTAVPESPTEPPPTLRHRGTAN